MVMKKSLSLLLFLLGSLSIAAQTPVRVAPDAIGSYSVIAFKVEFQADLDSLTFRNGKFHVSAADTGFLDTYPHDQNYFENHLTFLKNYWERVSKNKMQVSTKVISTVVTLPHVMSYYTSYKQNSDTAYSRLVRDFAIAAQQQIPNLTTEINSNYISENRTHFILFHAGLGHDINWVSIFGYDPTPRDISSIFLGEGFMKKNFSGNYLTIGGKQLTNLSILPETLTRPYEAFGRKSYLNFGINGLMTANMGNFLGLPDLYNAMNGNSVIGRFGLMDGYGFFNYNGHIPSVPSVWEKYQLGWVKPNIVSVNELPNQIRIHSDHTENNFDSSAVFLYLGSNRYYLLENKLRDNPSDKKGVTVSSVFNGNLTTQTFDKDENTFYYYDQSALKGVITDLSNFDWTFPGGINEKKDTIQGGVLIWRLDDDLVYQKMFSDSLSHLNSDKNNPALKLIEADGSFDIGKNYGSLQGASGSETGTIFDYFYKGNIAPLYKNKFDQDTRPSSDWNYHIPTGISINGFGRPNAIQNLTITSDIENPIVSLTKWSKTFSYEVQEAEYFATGLSDYALIFSADSLIIYKNGMWTNSFAAKVSQNQKYRAYAIHTSNDSLYLAFSSMSGNSAFDRSVIITISPDGNIQSNVVMVNDYILLDDVQSVGNGFVRLYRLNTDNSNTIKLDVLNLSGETEKSYTFTVSGITAENYTLTIIPNQDLNQVKLAISIPSLSKYFISDGNTLIEKTGQFQKLMTNQNGNTVQLLGYSSGHLSDINLLNGEINSVVMISEKEPDILLKKENVYYSLTSENMSLTAFENTMQLEYFPIINTNPINSEKVMLINNKEFVAYNSGKNWFIKSLFDNDEPLYLNLPNGILHFIENSESQSLTTAAIQNKNSIDFVRLSAVPVWGGTNSSLPFLNHTIGNLTRTKKEYTQSNHPDKMDAYVWPNPITDKIGYFRFNLPFNGSGKVIIHDLTGQVVETISVQVVKNQETEFQWSIGNAQSGLYLATVDISGDGQQLSKIIKVLITR